MARRREAIGLAAEIVVPALIVAGVAAISIAADSFFFPPFPEVVDAFAANWLFDRVGSDVVPSLARIFAGYGAAVAIGIPLGILLGLSRAASEYAQPPLDFIRALPPPALIPLAILILGVGDTMKVALVAVVAVFPILLNTIDGVRNLDRVLLESAAVYRARPLDRLRLVILPGALPQIVAGLRISLSLSLLLVVFSELVASENGIGNQIKEAQLAFDMPGLWSGLVLLGILGYLFNLLFVIVERRVLAWHRGSRESVLT